MDFNSRIYPFSIIKNHSYLVNLANFVYKDNKNEHFNETNLIFLFSNANDFSNK